MEPQQPPELTSRQKQFTFTVAAGIFSIPGAIIVGLVVYSAIIGHFLSRRGQPPGPYDRIYLSLPLFVGLAWIRGAFVFFSNNRDDTLLRILLWLIVTSLGVCLGFSFIRIAM